MVEGIVEKKGLLLGCGGDKMRNDRVSPSLIHQGCHMQSLQNPVIPPPLLPPGYCDLITAIINQGLTISYRVSLLRQIVFALNFEGY